MRILFDLHTHTRFSTPRGFSHAVGSVAQNLGAALAKGMGVGISNHGPAHVVYGISPKAYAALAREVEDANRAAGKKRALLSCECNLTSQKGTTDFSLLPFAPEVVLLGYHKGVLQREEPLFFWRAQRGGRAFAAKMTAALISAIEREPIDVITHPGEYVPVEYAALARAAAALGVVLEINDKHPMTEEQLNICAENGAYFVISSDAHKPARVGCFSRAAAAAKNAKIPLERIVNCDIYRFCAGLRVDKLAGFAQSIRETSTGFSTI